jgi:hypothetical protein
MPPKGGKGKAVKSSGTEIQAQLKRQKHALFAPTLTGADLKAKFQGMWAVETRAHPKTRVRPATDNSKVNKYPFFAFYFWCGLCPPYSDFYNDVMYTFNLRLLDLTPNAVTTMAVFAHLCENFAGVTPNTALFRHYFTPRAEKGEPLTAGVSWVSRTGAKDQYLKGDLRPRWGEIRSDWCWIVDDDPPSFCELRKTPVVRGTN